MSIGPEHVAALRSSPCNVLFHSRFFHLLSHTYPHLISTLVLTGALTWVRIRGSDLLRIAIKQHKDCEGGMTMSTTWAEKEAILQQLGVTQDQVIFYYTGKARGQCVSL